MSDSPSAKPNAEPLPSPIAFAAEWDDPQLSACLQAGAAHPAAALALARSAWATAGSSAENLHRARAGLVLGWALNRAERYALAPAILRQIEPDLTGTSLWRERAVAAWQAGKAARFLRADRAFAGQLESALDALLAAGLEVEAARCRRDLAAAYNWRGDYAASQAQTAQARAFFAPRGMAADAAVCAFAESARLRWAGRFDEALAILSQAEAVFDVAGLPAERATAWLYQGSVHVARMHFDRAAECLARAQSEFERLDLPHRLALCHNEWGAVAVHRAHLRQAETIYRHTRVRFRSLGMRADLAMASINLAAVRFHQGRIAAAREAYDQARDEFHALGDRWNETLCGLNVGTCHRALGQYAAAFQALEAARSAAAGMGAADLAALAEHNLGRAWLALGDAQAAIPHLAAAIRGYRAGGAHFPAARASVQLARAEAHLGRIADALIHVQEARIACESARAPGYLAACDQAEGEIQARSGDHARARESFAAAESAFETLGMPINAIACRLARADACLALNDSGSAERLYADGLAAAEIALPDLAWRGASGLARIEAARGERAAALEYHRRAIGSLSQARRSLHHEWLTEAFLQTRGEAMDRAIAAALEAGEVEMALAFVEESRAQRLAALLGGARATAGPSTGQRLNVLRQCLSDLRRRLGAAADEYGWSIVRPPSEAAQRLFAEFETRAREYQRLTTVAGEAAAGERIAFDLARLRLGLSRIAPAGWTCLAYYWLGSCLLTFVLDETSVQVVREEPGPMEAMALDLCTSPEPDRRRAVFGGGRAGQAYLKRLHDLLIPDSVRRRLMPDHLLAIVPAGRLHSLPFQALTDGASALTERAAITYAPSLAGLESCLERAEATGTPGGAALIVAVEDFGDRLPRLPHAGREADGVARFFEDAVVLRGPAATRSAFFAGAEGPRPVIHLATHAIFESRYGRLSRLLLHDGDLQADEIEPLRLAARLAVLSACQSALGQVHRGEEVVGLAQAFFAAGVPSVIAAQFAVDDPAAPDFMRAFYAEWVGRGRGPAFALAAAQRAWIAAGRPPVAWAAFGALGAP